MNEKQVLDEIRAEGAGELAELVKKLTELDKTRMDIVAPTTDMRARVQYPHIDSEANGEKGELRLDFTEIMPEDHELSSKAHSMPLTAWGHRQIAEKCGIPIRYYEKLRDAGLLKLAADNINGWVDQRDRRFIRTQGGHVRAFLSDKYRVLDHMQVIKAAGEEAAQYGAKVAKCELTDTRLYMKLIVPHSIAEIRQGDKLVQGIVFSNSEVGAGSFRAEPFAMRLICKNGMIGMDTFSRIHLGSKMDEGIWKSSDTENLETQTIYSQVKDLVKATFDPVQFNIWMDHLKQTTEVKLNKPSDAVRNIVTEYKIPEFKTEEIMNALVSEGDPTQYGLINAITATANKTESIENRIDLQRIGGELSVLEPAGFEKIANRAVA